VCKLSAWIIAAIGIVAVVVYVSTILPAIPYFRQDIGLSPYTYTTYSSVIMTLFVVVAPTIFFTVVLYVLGTLLEYMTGETKPIETEEPEPEDEEDNERLEIVPIPEMR
jgi:uncharacterized membrane protein